MVRHLVVKIKVRVSRLGMHHINESPHKNRSTCMCVHAHLASYVSYVESQWGI